MVRWWSKMKGNFCESFIIIKHELPFQDSIFPPCLFLEFLLEFSIIFSCCENFIKIQHKELCQDSKSLPGFLEDMEVPDEPGDGVIWHVSIIWSCSENFIKIQHQEPCKDSTHPPCPFLESWRRCRLVTNLEIVSYDMYQSYLVAVKISSKSNIRNPVKTLLVLIVPSWSLGGHVGFLTTLRKCHMTCVNPLKMLWKFHQNPT